MRRIRVFVELPLQPGAEVVLPPFAAEHLLRVLRLPEGAPVVCFNGDGHDYAGHLAGRGREARFACGGRIPAAAPESPLRITLAQCVARGEKMDAILQKATELGVAAVVPLVSERTEVRLDAERAERRAAHWQRVLRSACEQCGRAVVPGLAAVQTLPAWAASLPGDVARHVLDPANGVPVSALAHPSGDLVLVVGPEGGLSERDLAALRAAGFAGLRLGPRVLRTETAGPAALAALQARHGDF
jgi:16S rRNA (uracil1498-N3)-methyltransferase